MQDEKTDCVKHLQEFSSVIKVNVNPVLNEAAVFESVADVTDMLLYKHLTVEKLLTLS